MSIHPKTSMGYVHYTVRDLDKQIAFYRDLLGFRLLWREGDVASLGTEKRELLRLTADETAGRDRRSTGLYHTAFLVPTRWDLAHWVRRIIETRTPVQGTSNHGTHLAIYLPDPEGNGVELAWDFPPEQWPMRDGKWVLEAMPREGVDIEALLLELEKDQRQWQGIDGDTRVGHIHLHVASLEDTEHFYSDVLGFDVTAGGPAMGALFMSAGGYHHHIAGNIWKGENAPPPHPGALGLRYFSIVLPDQDALDEVLSRVKEAGIETFPLTEGVLVYDPSRNGVLLTVDASE